MAEQTLDPRVFSNMNAGAPYATYKKTILGKVYVEIINPFTGKPEGLLLFGTKGTDTEMVDVWSEMEDVFFRRANKVAFETGRVIKVTRNTAPPPKTIEQYSDEELKEVLNQRYAAFQKVLSGIKSESVVYRLLDLASDLEKSDRILTALRAKLAELQQKPLA